MRIAGPPDDISSKVHVVMTWASRPRTDYGAGIRGVRVGSGRPLVLIHGVGLSADSWGAQIDALASSFEIHALDLPGHGESAPLEALPSLAVLADHLDAALAGLGETLFVAGHSLGALVTLALAVRHPARVGAIAVLNAIHRRSPEASRAVLARAAGLSVTEPNDPSATVARWFGDALECPEARACDSWFRSVDPAAYKATYELFARADSPSDADLAALRCPALFLTGADEPNSTPAMSEEMAALVPGAETVIVPDAAHMAMMTHPETVSAALRSFFAGIADVNTNATTHSPSVKG